MSNWLAATIMVSSTLLAVILNTPWPLLALLLLVDVEIKFSKPERGEE